MNGNISENEIRAYNGGIPLVFISLNGNNNLFEELKEGGWTNEEIASNIDDFYSKFYNLTATNYSLKLDDIVWALDNILSDVYPDEDDIYLNEILGFVEAYGKNYTEGKADIKDLMWKEFYDRQNINDESAADYLESLKKSADTKYQDERLKLQSKMLKDQGAQQKFNSTTGLLPIAREDKSTVAKYSATYKKNRLTPLIGEYIFENIPLDNNVRFSFYNGRGRMYEPGIEIYQDFILRENYFNTDPDVITLIIFNGVPTINAKIRIDLVNNTVSYSTKAKFNDELIKILLTQLEFDLTLISEVKKTILYYGVNKQNMKSFTQIFGTFAGADIVLSSRLYMRDFENYNKGRIGKSGFSLTTKKCAMKYRTEKGRIFNITVSHDYASNYTSINGTENYEHLIILKFDKDIDESNMKDIDRWMGKAFVYCLNNSKKLLNIFSFVPQPESRATKERLDENYQSLKNFQPLVFNNVYKNYICSKDRSPLLSIDSEGGEEFVCNSNKYDGIFFKPNETISKYIPGYENIVCCYGPTDIQFVLPSNIKDILEYELSIPGIDIRPIQDTMEEMYIYNQIENPDTIFVRNSLYYSVRRCVYEDYYRGDYNIDEQSEQMYTIEDLYLLQDMFNINIYVINSQGFFVLPNNYAFPSYNLPNRLCCIIYCWDLNPIVGPIYVPIIDTNDFVYVFDTEINSKLYKLLYTTRASLIVKDKVIYNNTFNRGTIDNLGNVVAKYLDSNAKIRGVEIDTGSGSIFVEVPPFGDHYLPTFEILQTNKSKDIINYFGQPKNKYRITIDNQPYTVYAYNYLGYPDGIKAIINDDKQNYPYRPWYEVITIPVTQPRSLINIHIDTRNNLLLLLRLVYWSWYPLRYVETPTNRSLIGNQSRAEYNASMLSEILEPVDNLRTYYNIVEDVSPILPNYGTVTATPNYNLFTKRLNYVRFILGIEDKKIKVNSRIYTDVYNAFVFIELTRNYHETSKPISTNVTEPVNIAKPPPVTKPALPVAGKSQASQLSKPPSKITIKAFQNDLPDIVILKELIAVNYSHPDIVKFSNNDEFIEYTTYSRENSQVPLLATNQRIIFDQKLPIYFLNGKDLFKIHNEITDESMYIFNTRDNDSKLIYVDKIASI